jgi:hypothetical protein
MSASSALEADRIKEVMVDARIGKVLSLRTDSAVILEALQSISEFYTISKIFYLFGDMNCLMDGIFT